MVLKYGNPVNDLAISQIMTTELASLPFKAIIVHSGVVLIK